MIKSLSKKSSSGYTILEIIISIFILVLLFRIGQAGYSALILKKSLETTKKSVISDIRLAQEYASAGKATTGCSGLNGYSFISTSGSNSYYTINADCGPGTTIEIKKVYLSKLAKGINISSANVMFKVLGMGTYFPGGGNSATFILTQQTTLSSVNIVVTSGGEIQ